MTPNRAGGSGAVSVSSIFSKHHPGAGRTIGPRQCATTPASLVGHLRRAYLNPPPPPPSPSPPSRPFSPARSRSVPDKRCAVPQGYRHGSIKGHRREQGRTRKRSFFFFFRRTFWPACTAGTVVVAVCVWCAPRKPAPHNRGRVGF
jgi:hypothetical protein